MWLAIRIGVLYAAPVLAVAIAIVCCVRLWRGVRRGNLPRSAAIGRFAWLLLLPVAVVLAVWATGEVASYIAVGGGAYAFDADASMQFLWSLAPLAGYVALPIVLLFGVLGLAKPRQGVDPRRG